MKIECPLDKIKTVTPEYVKKAIDSKDITLIDVREIHEYASGHIKGSINIPLRELEYRINEIPKDKPIVSYCRSGNRSLGASVLLCSYGLKDIMHMDGGILKWRYELERGFPEEREISPEITEELLETFRLALSLEKGSLIFYAHALQNIKDASTQEALRRLADFEQGHAEKILQYYFYFSGEDPSMMKQYFESVDPEYTEGKIEINKLLLKVEKGPFVDEQHILEVALEKEMLAKDLYLHLASLSKEPRTTALYSILANEERWHIDHICDIIGKTAQKYA